MNLLQNLEINTYNQIIKYDIEWSIKSDDTLLFPLHRTIIDSDHSLIDKLQEDNTNINVSNLFDRRH